MSGMRFAAEVSDLELADYQRAVRLLLRHPLITASWPDERALPRVRRFAAELRRDLAEAFGYRLELHGATARLVRTADALDPDRPAVTRTGRQFDRQRYAYLSLALAVLGRAGHPDHAERAGRRRRRRRQPDHRPRVRPGRRHRTGGRSSTRSVGWRSVACCGSPTDPARPGPAIRGAGEALYDIARDVVFALFRPPRVLQHVDSVDGAAGTLDEPQRQRRAPRRRAGRPPRRRRPAGGLLRRRRRPRSANHLRGSALPADLHRLTGLRVERRAEGVLLVDTARLVGGAVPRHGVGGPGGGAARDGDGRPGRRPGRAPGEADGRARPACGAGGAHRPGRRRPAAAPRGSASTRTIADDHDETGTADDDDR